MKIPQTDAAFRAFRTRSTGRQGNNRAPAGEQPHTGRETHRAPQGNEPHTAGEQPRNAGKRTAHRQKNELQPKQNARKRNTAPRNNAPKQEQRPEAAEKKETHGIEPCVSEIRIVIRDYYHQLEWSTDPAIPDAECSPPLMVHLIV